MRKSVLTIILLCFCAVTYAQSAITLKGLSFGLGLPMEFRDLKAAGLSLQVGFDRTYPIKENFALGFYVSAGGGFLGEFHQQYRYDNYYSWLKFSTGLLMQFGDLKERPFILGVAPGTGFGLLDMDLVVPVEVRFGRMLTKKWYIFGEIVYGISLAKETVSLEPSVRVGYNF